jgi:DNA polymerase-3 subunit alpha
MPTGPFAHLHCHSHYSLLDGASRLPELAAHVKELGMSAVALTDHGNLFGAIEFYRECKAAGVNPIIGYEAYVAPVSRFDREAKRRGDAGYHLTLLARDRTGFQNLVKLASIAYLEGYYYVPRIDKEVLETHKEGLICLSGCASSETSELILQDKMDEARKTAEWFARVFGKHYYIEIQNNGLSIQRQCMCGACEIARQLGLPLVATSDAHYLRQGDAPAHDVLLCINTRRKLSDPQRMRYGEGDGKMVDQFYVCGPEEMYERFPEHAEAVKRSQEIADSCNIVLDFKARHFPVFTPPRGKTPEDYLRELCDEGVKLRYGDNPPPNVLKRLEHELGIICRMGFASYFLIVSDFVSFAVENKIPASARGSACGALVSYLLQLSHVDPLEYDLLFERFLDPSRSEAPDIDIDFCQDRREEVIAYVKRKYGEGSVAQIATFGTLAARAAIKDVGRALDVDLARVNQLTSWVPKTLNITLDEALEQSADLRQAYQTDLQVRELLDIARKLEGTNRNAGTHAAGVVISNGPLTNYAPLQRVVRKDESEDGEGEVIITTQWVMGDIEKVGLLKMDFLGLRTLTLLDNAVRLIEKTRGEKIDVQKLPLDDPETYVLLCRGDAKGVFQFESDGIRELLKRLRPDNIYDIIACTALYRPATLQSGMADEFVEYKHGRKTPSYPHPIMEEILRETYSIIVFQEQVMQMLNRIGGIELASAYACIKAISKKKQDIIDQRKADFLKGASERGLDEDTAAEIWERIEVFAKYGFNKSHSAAYAVVSYQTAYLKTHYTAEFMAALLSSEIEDGNKRDIMVQHIDDARKFGIAVLPPDVNASEPEFSVVVNPDGSPPSQIVFGLTAIKGFGRGASEEVVRARVEGGRPFRDIFDFCERVNLRVVSKAAIEKLICAGALDRLGGHRAQLMYVLPRAIQAASEKQEDRRLGQRSLFDTVEDDSPGSHTSLADVLPDVPPWPETEKLKYEKEALDFYLSSHPLAQYAGELRRFATHTAADIPKVQPGAELTLGGMITQIRLKDTKTARNGNTRYMRCKVEDFSGSVECVMWPDDFARYKEAVVEDRPVFVRGTLDERSTREQPVIILTRIYSVEQAKKEGCNEVWLLMRLAEHPPHLIDSIGRILQRTPGTCPVWVRIVDEAGKQATLRLGRAFSVNPLALVPQELEDVLGEGSVKFRGSGTGR